MCDFLLVINTIWYPISYRFEVIADYCSNFLRKTVTLRFWTPFGGLRAMYTVHLMLTGKLVGGVDFLLVLIELLLLCVTAEALPSEYLLETGVSQGGGSVLTKFSCRRGGPTRTIFAWRDTPMNALQLSRWRFSHKLRNNFLWEKCTFRLKMAVLRFWAPCGDLGATYAVHLRLIGKRIVDFLYSDNWTFFTRSYGWDTTSENPLTAFLKERGQFGPKFQV